MAIFSQSVMNNNNKSVPLFPHATARQEAALQKQTVKGDFYFLQPKTIKRKKL